MKNRDRTSDGMSDRESMQGSSSSSTASSGSGSRQQSGGTSSSSEEALPQHEELQNRPDVGMRGRNTGRSSEEGLR